MGLKCGGRRTGEKGESKKEKIFVRRHTRKVEREAIILLVCLYRERRQYLTSLPSLSRDYRVERKRHSREFI